MSLWEKWEREKLEKQGVKVQPKYDVEIHETHFKPNFQKQVIIAMMTLFGCMFLVGASMLAETLFTGKRWSDTYFAQLLVSRAQQREEIAKNQ